MGGSRLLSTLPSLDLSGMALAVEVKVAGNLQSKQNNQHRIVI